MISVFLVFAVKNVLILVNFSFFDKNGNMYDIVKDMSKILEPITHVWRNNTVFEFKKAIFVLV